LAAPPQFDPNSWGPFEWIVTGLTTTVTTVSGFIWGTRTQLAEHDRRIETLESEFATDLRRLESKIDNYHTEMSRLILSLATGTRPSI
jgi:hypothetical protein